MSEAAAEVNPEAVSRVRVVKKHPLAIRWMHWIHFPVWLILLWSGTLILWANDVYPTEIYQAGYRLTHGGRENPEPPQWLKVPDRVIVHKGGVARVYAGADVPEGLPAEDSGKRYDVVLGYRLAEGMAWHFAFAWIFTLNGIAYALYLAISGAWRDLLPGRDSPKKAFLVVWRDLAFWRKPELAIEGEKYNHAQRFAYTGVVVMGFGMVLTGLAIYKPAQLAWLAGALGGYQAARLEHFVITALFVAFLLVHVAQVARAGWNNLRGMLTGRELVRGGIVGGERVTPEGTKNG